LKCEQKDKYEIGERFSVEQIRQITIHKLLSGGVSSELQRLGTTCRIAITNKIEINKPV
jgi:hypothetical protein